MVVPVLLLLLLLLVLLLLLSIQTVLPMRTGAEVGVGGKGGDGVAESMMKI